MTSAPSMYELALLAARVYGDGESPEIGEQDHARSWRRAESVRSSNGLSAATYVAEGKHPVVSVCGSDGTWDYLVEDVCIAIGAMPPQVVAAIGFIESQVKLHGLIYLTGHSLGGALAAIAASHWLLPCVSFNAPGAVGPCEQSALLAGKRLLAVRGQCRQTKRIHNIRINGDLVSTRLITGGPVGGEQTSLPAPQCGLFDPLCRHSIFTIIDVLASDDQSRVPVEL